MGNEARGRSDLAFQRTLIHAAIKEACRQAGYESIQIGNYTMIAKPGNVRKLGQVAKQLGLATHVISFDDDRDTVTLLKGALENFLLEMECFLPFVHYVLNDTTSPSNTSGDKDGASGADK